MSSKKNLDGSKTYPEEVIRKLPRWQADHIVPVAEGGGLCGLDGYRTLCSDCHKRVTRQLNQRLKEKRRGEHREDNSGLVGRG